MTDLGSAESGPRVEPCTIERRRRALMALGTLGLAAWPNMGLVAAPVARTVSSGSSPESGKAPTQRPGPDASNSRPGKPVFGPAVPGAHSDAIVNDTARGRQIGVRMRWPAVRQASPLILYSPGLGSGLSNGQAWCDAWQKAGFAVITLSHPHTNEELWDTRSSSFSQNMAAALEAGQYPARVADCRYVLDQCLRDAELAHWIDPQRIGAAGHSYGALTVQALTGQAGPSQRDERIRAAISLSPGSGSRGSAARMKTVKIPFLSLTGSHDGKVSFIQGTQRIQLGIPVEQRLWIHEALPVEQRYLVVLDQADHMSFAGEIVNRPIARFSRSVPESDEADRKVWERVSALTTQFWQASLSPSGPPEASALKNAMRANLGPQDRLS